MRIPRREKRRWEVRRHVRRSGTAKWWQTALRGKGGGGDVVCCRFFFTMIANCYVFQNNSMIMMAFFASTRPESRKNGLQWTHLLICDFLGFLGSILKFHHFEALSSFINFVCFFSWELCDFRLICLPML